MTYRTEEKARWLSGWKASGKKIWAYAKENGLIPQTFYSWVKKQDQAKPGFVEVRTQAGFVSLRPGLLIEKGDIKIHIPLGMNATELRVVMEGLGVTL